MMPQIFDTCGLPCNDDHYARLIQTILHDSYVIAVPTVFKDSHLDLPAAIVYVKP